MVLGLNPNPANSTFKYLDLAVFLGIPAKIHGTDSMHICYEDYKDHATLYLLADFMEILPTDDFQTDSLYAAAFCILCIQTGHKL